MAQQLWLLRHGEAVPHESKPDEERELTPRGERQSDVAGQALAQLGLEFAACYTSPLVRAVGTAALACRALNVEPQERDPVGKGFDAVVVRQLLLEQEEDDARVLVVGHNPSFEQVVYDLTGARVDLKKGGVAGIRLGDGPAELIALLRPKELEAIAAPTERD
jgi:phosphohistidine phosphatase